MRKLRWGKLSIGMMAVLAVTPAPGQSDSPDAKSILGKSYAAYTAAKTYQGTWGYTLTRGDKSRAMSIDIKAKTPNHLFFKVTANGDAKPVPGEDPIPEMLVNVDGKTAWFLNTSENTYFRILLTANSRVTPLMFMPMIQAASETKRVEDKTEDGRKLLVIQAATADGGLSRMEIDSETYRVRRFVQERTIALMKVVSTIQVEKETFDSAIADSQFNYRPPKKAKEIPAPLGAAQTFGPN